MQSTPWLVLQQVRRAHGLRQRDVAAGLMTQSMLSQIEHGRVIPTETLLKSILQRLDENNPELEQAFAVYRQRHRVRERLWLSFCVEDIPGIERSLAAAYQLLNGSERLVYAAYQQAMTGDYRGAEANLLHAWGMAPVTSSAPARGVASEPAMLQQCDWSAADRARAMVVEARTHVAICIAMRRVLAAEWWLRKMQSRLRTSVG